MTEILMPGFALTDYHGRLLQGYPEAVELAKAQGKRMMTYNFAPPNEPGQARWRFGMGFFFESLGKGCEGQFIHAYYYVVGDPYNLLDGKYAERTYHFPSISGGGATLARDLIQTGSFRSLRETRWAVQRLTMNRYVKGSTICATSQRSSDSSPRPGRQIGWRKPKRHTQVRSSSSTA